MSLTETSVTPRLPPGDPARCLCIGDGETWADAGRCPVHDEQTSPMLRALSVAYDRGLLVDRVAWLEAALRAIEGPADSGPFIFAYREAGGGYEGLQAVARMALAGSPGE